jgi:hypothetical protein
MGLKECVGSAGARQTQTRSDSESFANGTRVEISKIRKVVILAEATRDQLPGMHVLHVPTESL